jgi:hypothetical protein
MHDVHTIALYGVGLVAPLEPVAPVASAASVALVAPVGGSKLVTSPVLSRCCAPTYAFPISPPSLFVPTGPLYRLYRTNFGRCRDLDA